MLPKIRQSGRSSHRQSITVSGKSVPSIPTATLSCARRAAQEAGRSRRRQSSPAARRPRDERGRLRRVFAGADAMILDEAHQILDLATQFFGVALGSRELERIIEEVRTVTMAWISPSCNVVSIGYSRPSACCGPRRRGRVEGTNQLGEVIAEIRAPLDELRAASPTCSRRSAKLPRHRSSSSNCTSR